MRVSSLAARIAAAAVASLCVAGVAWAQSYPSKPIRLVVPFPPGGPADLLGRVISQRMSEGFKTQVVVDNKPGGNTVIAAEHVAKSAPDGYTLLMAIDSTLTMNQSLYTKLSYDPIKDFEPVSLIAIVPTMLIASNSVAPGNIQELIAWAKSKPEGVHFAAGTITMHLAGELFGRMAGVKMIPVFYKGGSTTTQAIMGGEIPLSFESTATALPAWRAGKVKAIALLGARRLANAPDLPTAAEQGLPGYDVFVWQSIVAPAGTPRDVIAKVNAELARVLSLPDTRERLAAAGLEPRTSTPEELAAFARAETVKWGKIIKEIGLKID